MLPVILKEALKLAVIAVMLFLLLQRYLRWKRPHLAPAVEVEQHRVIALLYLGTALVGIKVSEEALSGASGPVDKAILLYIHHHVPGAWTGFFEAVTLSGSFDFLVGLAVVLSVGLLMFRRGFEVLLLIGSAIGGGLAIYLLKLASGRERPALWETRWYWGTSFPSGHTLETACFGMAIALCVGRIWPGKASLTGSLALVWCLLVGCSRLVLGVHWPTDVLAAMCIGMLIPAGVQILIMRFRLVRVGRERTG